VGRKGPQSQSQPRSRSHEARWWRAGEEAWRGRRHVAASWWTRWSGWRSGRTAACTHQLLWREGAEWEIGRKHAGRWLLRRRPSSTSNSNARAQAVEEAWWRKHCASRWSSSGAAAAAAMRVEEMLETRWSWSWSWSLQNVCRLTRGRWSAAVSVRARIGTVEEGRLCVGSNAQLLPCRRVSLSFPVPFPFPFPVPLALALALRICVLVLPLAILQLLDRGHLLVRLRHPEQQLFCAHGFGRIPGALHQLHQKLGIGLVCAAATTTTTRCASINTSTALALGVLSLVDHLLHDLVLPGQHRRQTAHLLSQRLLSQILPFLLVQHLP
jgi:hypothetical protein